MTATATDSLTQKSRDAFADAVDADANETPQQANLRKAREAKAAKAEAKAAEKAEADAKAAGQREDRRLESTGFRDPIAYFRGKAANILPDATRVVVKLRLEGGHLHSCGQFSIEELETDKHIELFLQRHLVPKFRKISAARSTSGLYVFEVTLQNAKGHASVPIEYPIIDTDAPQGDVGDRIAAALAPLVQQQQQQQAPANPFETVAAEMAKKALADAMGGGGQMSPMLMMMLPQLMAPKGPDPMVVAALEQVKSLGSVVAELANQVKQVALIASSPPAAAPAPAQKEDTMEKWFKLLFPAGVAALLEQISGKNQVAALQSELSNLRHEVANAANSRSELKGYLETYKMLESIKSPWADMMKSLGPTLLPLLLGQGGGIPGMGMMGAGQAPPAPKPAPIQATITEVHPAPPPANAQPAAPPPPPPEPPRGTANGQPVNEASGEAPVPPAPTAEDRAAAEAKASQVNDAMKPPEGFDVELKKVVDAADDDVPAAAADALKWLAERNPIWKMATGKLGEWAAEMLDDEATEAQRKAQREQLGGLIGNFFSAMKDLGYLRTAQATRLQGILDEVDGLDAFAEEFLPDDPENTEDDKETP